MSRWKIPTIKFSFLFKGEVESKGRIKSWGGGKNKKMAISERIHVVICSNKNTIYTTVATTVNTAHKI